MLSKSSETYDQKRRSVDGDTKAKTNYTETEGGWSASKTPRFKLLCRETRDVLIPRARMNWVMLTDWHCSATPPSITMPPTKMPFLRPSISLITGAMGSARKAPMFWTDVMIPVCCGKIEHQQSWQMGNLLFAASETKQITNPASSPKAVHKSGDTKRSWPNMARERKNEVKMRLNHQFVKVP